MMGSSEEDTDAKIGTEGGVEWDLDMKIQLFYAMAHHKPVGINKHFNMICIWEKLTNSITKEITPQDIWKHLDTLYDLPMLDDTEPIPFPNEEVAFSLPDAEYGELIKQKCKEVILGSESDDGRSSSPKMSTPQGSRSAGSKDSTPKGSRKDSTGSMLATKTRKESGSSHASTDTPSIKSEKDYDRRRDSRDSNASGPRDSSIGRKSTQKAWESPLADEESSSRRGRRRANTSTPPATVPAKRRRT